MTTPVRRLRTRAITPLPAVAPRASTAYGTQGKASLHAQVTTTAMEFDNAFEKALPRRNTPARKSRDPSRKPASPSHSPALNDFDRLSPEEVRTTGSAVATQFHEESDPGDERPGTAIQTSALYGADTLPHVRFPDQVRDIRQDDQSAEADYEPGRLQVLLRTLPRYFPRLFRDANSFSIRLLLQFFNYIIFLLGVLFLLYSLFSRAPLPGSLSIRRDALVKGTSVFFGLSHDRPPDSWEINWYSFLHDKLWAKQLDENATIDQYRLNVNLLTRIETLEQRLIELGEQVSLHRTTLAKLEDMLPSAIVLRKVNNKWEIGSNFWDALADRLSQGESAPLWQAFLDTNKQKFMALSQEHTDNALRSAMKDGHVLTAAAFSGLIDDNFQQLRSAYRADFKEMQKSHVRLIQSIANQSAIDAIDRNPISSYAKSQLETLVKANQIHSVYEALRTPNYFSAGMGARIDHHLTSPTMQRTPSTWAQWMWTRLSPLQYDKNPPIAALQRWDEATDCWCSAPSYDAMGSAQLTVAMPYQFYPDVLVVEHIPASGSLDITTAPRELELWAEMESPKRAQEMIANMTVQVPFYTERSSKCGEAPTSKFVCIGKALYDIHSHKYIQSFRVWVDAVELDLRTTKITVRVTENWGGPWTCIYRLRMTGTRLEEVVNGVKVAPTIPRAPELP